MFSYVNTKEYTTDKVTTNIRIEQIFKERGNKAVLHLAKLTESFPAYAPPPTKKL